MTAELHFSHITKTFQSGAGRTKALDDVSLTIDPGSFVAIVGPSGCGKSTLLHIAAGLDTQHDGTFQRTPSNAVGACLFQTPRLLPWLSAAKNVAFALEARGLGRRASAARATEMLDVVGLSKFAGHFPSQLSGGMQQRVALARALAVDPDALLMDEPFSALDELTARRLRAELLDLYAAKPRTTVFVTHNIYEACYLADVVVVMSPQPGSIIAEVEISVPRPRTYEQPELMETAAKILALIEGEVGTHSNRGDTA